jgi:hypothetical protein
MALNRFGDADGENGAIGRYSHSYSPVDGDARAFNYWDETAIIPISWWVSQESQERYFELGGTEAVLVTVDDGELVQQDRVSHPMRRECDGPERGPVTYVEPDDIDAILAGDVDFNEVGTSTPGGLDPDQDDDNGNDEDSTDDNREGDAEAGFVDKPDDTDEPVMDEPATEIFPGTGEYCWIYTPEIIRTVVIDDTLFTVASNGVGVHDFERGSRIDWIPFERL